MGLSKRVWRYLLPIVSILVFFWWFQLTPPGLLGKMDGVGYAVCHRIEERSFHVEGRQMPLCARCTGTFSGAFIGLVVQGIVARRRSGLPSRATLAFLAFLALLWAVDGTNSYLYLLKEVGGGAISIPNLYIPNNALRLFTGSGMGLAMALVLYPVLQQTLWREVDSRPALSRRAIAFLLGGVYLLDLAILTEHPLVLYPIAIISPLGVLALLTIVFGMLWVMVMGNENTFEHPRQLWLPALAGLTLAFLLIGGIDLFRLRLTGTWGGYPLP